MANGSKCKWMTQAAYARARNLSQAYVSGLCSKGVIKKNLKRIDPVQADAAIADFADPACDSHRKGGELLALTKPVKGTIHYWRKEDLKLKAALRQLEHDERIGLLVRKEDERAKGFAAGKKVKDALYQVTDRVSALLAAETDEVRVRSILLAEFNQLCGELAGEG